MNIVCKQILSELNEIRGKCDGKRFPTEQERKRVLELISNIESLEYVFDEVIDKDTRVWLEKPASEAIKIDPAASQSRRADSKGYEKREYNQSKDFRSCFGSQSDGFRWTDRNSNIFQAIFSQRFHPDLRTMQELVPSDGGFLLDVQSSSEIFDLALEKDWLLPRATVFPTKAATFKVDAMELSDHSTSVGGVIAYFKGENADLTLTSPKLREIEFHPHKLTELVKISNELYSDAGNKVEQIKQKLADALQWHRLKSWIRGTGVGQPLGILNSRDLIVIDKELGQSPDTIIYENLVKMMARLLPGSFENCLWVTSPSTLNQLLSLSIPVGVGGGHYPVLNESNGKFRLLTREIIFSEHCSILGDEGDILLLDPRFFGIALRSEIRIDVSPHVFFTNDQTAIRLTSRFDGSSLMSGTQTLRDGTSTASAFVTLGARS